MDIETLRADVGVAENGDARGIEDRQLTERSTDGSRTTRMDRQKITKCRKDTNCEI